MMNAKYGEKLDSGNHAYVIDDQGLSRESPCYGAWHSAEELPPLEQIVFLDLGNGSVILGARTDCDDGWLYGNCYGNVWWDGNKWDGDVEVDDDYQPVRWHPLPLVDAP